MAMKLLALGLLGLASALPAAEPRADGYEYIVVGSGAGGGTLASRLAREGHSTLLIEAGDDQSSNDNTTIPIFQYDHLLLGFFVDVLMTSQDSCVWRSPSTAPRHKTPEGYRY
jgi:choline dehydrogenase-like flavoprotein